MNSIKFPFEKYIYKTFPIFYAKEVLKKFSGDIYIYIYIGASTFVLFQK